MRSRLGTTNNLIHLYMDHCGRSEVPAEYHLWSCLSLIAACLADRVYFTKHDGIPLVPNLYVLLIGPSGNGKSVAMDAALRFTKELHSLNVFNGEITAAGLADELGARGPARGYESAPRSKLWLVTDELAQSVGTGTIAVDFIRMMTRIYRPGAHSIRKRTVTRGEVRITDACINWLGGSTREWLVESMPSSAIKGGTLGRMALVNCPYNFDIRIPTPQYPDDQAQLVNLRAQLAQRDGSAVLTFE